VSAIVARIVSGGQTGVDRAALDAALELGLPCGGWCPQGRLAEDGIIAVHYPLQETPTADYPQRTQWNVRDSDGTLVLTIGPPLRGTAFTIEVAGRLNKPCLVLDLDYQPGIAIIHHWVKAHDVQILNVAGPRESTYPGIYARAKKFLIAVMAEDPSTIL
jgi:hypothetical protein